MLNRYLYYQFLVKQKLVGFIGFDNVVSSENWSINDIDLLLTTASVFSYALERQASERELNKSFFESACLFRDLNSDFCNDSKRTRRNS